MVDVIASVTAVFNHAYAEITQKLYGYLYSTSFYFRHIFGIVRQSLVSTFSRMALSFTCPRGRTYTPDIMQVSSPLTQNSIKLQPMMFHDPHHWKIDISRYFNYSKYLAVLDFLKKWV